MCLQSSERADVKRRSQLGRGAGVGGERGGRGGGIRRGGRRRGVTAVVQDEDAGNGHIHDTLTQLRIQFPGNGGRTAVSSPSQLCLDKVNKKKIIHILQVANN